MDWPRIARTADAAVVTALVVSGQVSVWAAGTGPPAEDRAVHALLLAAATVPLFVRRASPLPVLLLVLGATWVQFQLGGGVFQPWFAVLLGLYAVAAHAGIREALLGAAGVAALTLAVDIPKLAAGDPVDEVIPAWFVLAGTWGLGRWIRHRRHETEQLQERAAVAERDSAEQAAAAVADERARIARELHDLVAHSMGVIVIQSQAGQRSLDARPDLARGALQSIETAGRQGLAEMRRLLGLLTGASDGTVAPQPSLDGLDELVERVRAAGVPVELTVDGDVDSLPSGVELAAYRIVQEALTNVLKHAGPATARVVVRARCGAVDIEVCDDGPGTGAAPGRGHGLVGMRERAALYGGSVEAGVLPGGGFRVHARLAVDGRPA
ncbi:sensor histidine kinase [Blastococcus jejuensis]|uniref:histidine kinase n=1 Tax=Blastococcus jejuensis TaxID=351224 RepID=A0ABP6PP06_9ACTN